MRVKEVAVHFKAGPEDGLKEGEFIVYPSTFTRQPDSYGDVVSKGAFLDTIKEWEESGNVLPGLYGHRMDDPDYFVAGASEMTEDDHGWRIKGEFDLESPKGPQVYRLVKGRRLNQLSFAYDVEDEAQVELEDGTKANELRKLKVYEFSFVPIGANQDTSVVAVKSAVNALEASVKRGAELSARNVETLEQAANSAKETAKTITELLARVRGEDGASSSANNDQEKASGHTAATAEASAQEPSPATAPAEAKEQRVNPSVDVWATQLSLLALGNE